MSSEQSAVTIFGVGPAKRDTILETLEARGGAVDDSVGPGPWPELIVDFPSGRLVMNKREVVAGNDGARTILGMFNFVKNNTAPSAARDRVMDHVARSRTLLGVQAFPALSASDERWAALTTVAVAVDGVLFDGGGVSDSAGKLMVRVSTRA